VIECPVAVMSSRALLVERAKSRPGRSAIPALLRHLRRKEIRCSLKIVKIMHGLSKGYRNPSNACMANVHKGGEDGGRASLRKDAGGLRFIKLVNVSFGVTKLRTSKDRRWPPARRSVDGVLPTIRARPGSQAVMGRALRSGNAVE